MTISRQENMRECVSLAAGVQQADLAHVTKHFTTLSATHYGDFIDEHELLGLECGCHASTKRWHACSICPATCCRGDTSLALHESSCKAFSSVMSPCIAPCNALANAGCFAGCAILFLLRLRRPPVMLIHHSDNQPRMHTVLHVALSCEHVFHSLRAASSSSPARHLRLSSRGSR